MTDLSHEKSEIAIRKPAAGYDEILMLMGKIADETDALPFTSRDIGININSMKNYIQSLNKEPNSIYLVAYIGSRPIGFAYLEGGKRERTYHTTTLGIGVLEGFAHQGLGSKMMEAILDFARTSENIAKIDLQVRKDNTRAIRLYKKFGFEVEGVHKRALFIQGEFFDYINMGKSID